MVNAGPQALDDARTCKEETKITLQYMEAYIHLALRSNAADVILWKVSSPTPAALPKPTDQTANYILDRLMRVKDS